MHTLSLSNTHHFMSLLQESVFLCCKVDSLSPSPSPPSTPPISPPMLVCFIPFCDPIYFQAAAIPRLLNAGHVSRETITWRSATPVQKYEIANAIYDSCLPYVTAHPLCWSPNQHIGSFQPLHLFVLEDFNVLLITFSFWCPDSRLYFKVP